MDRDSYRGASGQVVSDDSSDSDSHSSSDSASLEGSTRDRRRANFFRQLHEVGQRGTTCDELSNPDAGADSNASSSIGPQRNRRRENFIRRYREVNITPLIEKHKQSLYDPTSILYPGSHRPLPRPEGSHSGFAQVKEGNPSSSQILPSNAPSVGGSSQAPGSHRTASHSSEDKSPQVFSSNS
ncbi:hypothetical protein SCHPADRAFT_947035 [Schizopora paradoxa]|uniref:Uncharacterized protein n=1 Tax=Schizopora paradoxa TaxID=27342 RepID=A0A0H2RKH0_9AGAM|nr:hypothetical protein SCHPADRAFT_947035 [Schizopora paradoxa]